jgi:hypothetical protein
MVACRTLSQPPSSSPTYARRRPEKTALYRVVQEHLETFLELSRSDETGLGVPVYVERALRGFLACGILAHGFLRTRCLGCGFERLVPFSCKSREICPSCTARRMAEVSAHLVDRVLPDVPVRQWVLTVPWALRGWLARDRELVSTVVRIFLEEVFRWLCGQTAAGSDAKGGAVTFIQRFGNTLNLHLHFHVIALDGLYARDTETGELVFHPNRQRPREEDERSVAKAVYCRMVRLFRRRGWMDELGRLLLPEEPTSPLPFSDQTAFRFLGPGTGLRRERRSRGEYGGFSVHAGVQIREGDKAGREKLVRYAARPPFAFEQVELTEGGQVLFHLEKPRASGQDAMLLDPIDFLRRLAWLVPPPWLNQTRYHGVLAPASKWRKEVVPEPEVKLDLDRHASLAPEAELHDLPPSGLRYDWAKLLARVWSIDVTTCPNCDGKVRIIAAIQKPDAIERILSHLGLPTEAPKVRGARAPPMDDLFDGT